MSVSVHVGSRARLRIYSTVPCPIRSVRNIFQTLEHAYDSIYVLQAVLTGVQRFSMDRERSAEIEIMHSSGIRIGMAMQIPARFLMRLVGKDEQLTLVGAEFHSQGSWDLLGNGKALDAIRKAVQDRHERRKDREYREAAEEERLQLENLRLRNEVIQGQIEIAKKAGFSEEEIQGILKQLYFGPVTKLNEHVDKGLIQGAEIEDEED